MAASHAKHYWFCLWQRWLIKSKIERVSVRRHRLWAAYIVCATRCIHCSPSSLNPTNFLAWYIVGGVVVGDGTGPVRLPNEFMHWANKCKTRRAIKQKESAGIVNEMPCVAYGIYTAVADSRSFGRRWMWWRCACGGACRSVHIRFMCIQCADLLTLAGLPVAGEPFQFHSRYCLEHKKNRYVFMAAAFCSHYTTIRAHAAYLNYVVEFFSEPLCLTHSSFCGCFGQ